jgi:hypothetical protein
LPTFPWNSGTCAPFVARATADVICSARVPIPMVCSSDGGGVRRISSKWYVKMP